MGGDRKTGGFGGRILRAIRALTGAGLGLGLIVSLALSLDLGQAGCRLILDDGPLPARLEPV